MASLVGSHTVIKWASVPLSGIALLATLAISGRVWAGTDGQQVPFAADAGVGVMVGSLRGVGVEKGVNTSVLVRWEGFADAPDDHGPRIGASVWGAFPVGPQPLVRQGELGATGLEVPTTGTVELWSYGVAVAVRADPRSKVAMDVSFGFERTDLRGVALSTSALPGLMGEVGLRHRLASFASVSWTARASWLASPSPAPASVAEVPAGTTSGDWFSLQFGPVVNLRLR